MVASDTPGSPSAGVSPEGSELWIPRLGATERLEADLRIAMTDYALAREAFFTAFLRAKISHKNPTDRQAEASAEVEAGAEMVAAETRLFIAKQKYAAAIAAREV